MNNNQNTDKSVAQKPSETKKYHLGINTASSTSTIFIADESGNYLDGHGWNEQNREAEKLMPAIDALIEKHCTYADLAAIYCISGPGSFTGLRVGVTVANTISYLKKIPLYPITTFEYLRTLFALNENANPQTATVGQVAAILLFAGKRGVYLATVGAPNEPDIIPLDQLGAELNRRNVKIAYGDISLQQQEVVEGAGTVFTNVITSTNSSLAPPAEKFATICSQLNPQPTTIIRPFYVKGPGISKAKPKF